MFIDYKIDNDILYLEINVNYEFAGEEKNKNIFEHIKEYISNMKIKNNFKKIVITCSGVIIGSLIFFNNSNDINSDYKYVPNFDNNITFVNKDDDNISNNVVYENSNISIQNSESTISNIKNNEINTNITNNLEDISIQNTIDNTNNVVETQPSVSNSIEITVHRSSGEIINLDLNDYLIGVIASEMPASFNSEALKAQSVAARTYALKAKKNGKILTDTVSTQSYIDINQMREKWGYDFDFYYNKIKDAVISTDGEYLTYNGDYIEAMYHSTNNGKTESSLDVFGNYYPYLVSVSSEFDKSASSYLRENTYDINTISSKLGINLNNDTIIEVLSYTDGGNIKEISIDGKVFSGKNFRELLGLRSADFDININDNSVNITTRGFGHGVGLSQYGANGMANAGYDYRSILSHYYQTAELKK